MAILYDNFIGGLTTDAPLVAGATTINSAGFANLSTVASPNLMWLVLDPDGVGTGPEIVLVTAHTASATSVTVLRGQQGTTATEHAVNTTWIHAATAQDFDTLPTSVLTTKGDLIAATGANAVARRPVGANDLVLTADSTIAEGLNWKQVATAGIADKAVTGPKMSPALAIAERTTNQAISHNTSTVVTLADALDPLNWHDGNGVFTPTIAGRYRVHWRLQWGAPGAGVTYSRLFHQVRKNAANVGRVDQRIVTVANVAQSLTGTSDLFSMNGTTDTCDLQVLHLNSGSASVNVENAEVSLELVQPS